MTLRKLLPVLLLAGLTAGLTGCDHATKHAARKTLKGQPNHQVIPGVLELTYTENRGLAFSADRWLPSAVPRWIFPALRTVILVFMLGVWISRRRAPLSEHLAWCLVLAGALGNGLDTLFRGRVVDFIHLAHWPVFNLADIYLAAGCCLLALLLWRKTEPEPTRRW